MGRECAQFETAFAEFMGIPEAVFVNSGSSANLLIFFALANLTPRPAGKRPFTPGSEVIVPAVTWPTTIWPIVQAGGIPVLVDCDLETLQIDVDAARHALTERTIGVCPVHVLGNVVRIDQIKAFAEDHGLWLIEDTCEALGSRYSGQLAGTFGDVASFSFYFSHHITTIEGGMILTRDHELAELLRSMRAHGWTRDLRGRQQAEEQHADLDSRFLFISTGFNLRPTEVNAAFGRVQLRKLESFNMRRREIASRWTTRFHAPIAAGLFRPMQVTPGTDAAWFGYPVVCRDSTIRNALLAHLRAAEVETRPIICGNMARQPAMQRVPHRVSGVLAAADRVMDSGLLWGTHPLMTDAEIDYVGDVIAGFASRV